MSLLVFEAQRLDLCQCKAPSGGSAFVTKDHTRVLFHPPLSQDRELQCWQTTATEEDRRALWEHCVGPTLTDWAGRDNV